MPLIFVLGFIYAFSVVQSAFATEMKALCYGPGLYGNKTASGIRLNHDLCGLAHKTLPLGKKIKVKYSNKQIVLPIIDRGPYATKAQLDITEAAVRELGFHNCQDFGARTVSVEIQD